MNTTGAHIADTQGQARQEHAQSAGQPGSNPADEHPEKRPVAAQEAPEEGHTPAALADQSAARPAVEIRKQLIPPRRATGENGYRPPFAVRKYARSADEHQPEARAAAEIPTSALPVVDNRRADSPTALAELPTAELSTPQAHASRPGPIAELPTTPLPVVVPVRTAGQHRQGLTRGRALLLALLLLILIINATATGFGQFFGPRGWGAIFNPASNTNQALLNQLRQELQATSTPGVPGQATASPLTPLQIVDRLLATMTLPQKLGQMLMVRFNALNYSPQLDAMITSYHVGSVIEYQGNIQSKAQLTSLNAQIQHNGDLPVIISIDQEGGTVDRLRNLDGPQPSASSLGITGNPRLAYQQGLKDAQDLAAYGFNLNLAPVIDVNNVYNPQLYERTYSTNPAMVTALAGAYLDGLQHSGRVLGSIKHFPGLGDTSTDPHYGLPYLTRSLDTLNAVDWVPYKGLIGRGTVYAVMVTHEIVRALDPQTPSSLSARVIGILRNQLGFQGVIVTDGLTMRGITNSYTLGQAAVMAVQAGDDLLMDPGSPNEVAQMIDSLTQAVQSGTISLRRIDDSVRRILLLKYQMGLFQLKKA